jgi:hypothetical protein
VLCRVGAAFSWQHTSVTAIYGRLDSAKCMNCTTWLGIGLHHRCGCCNCFWRGTSLRHCRLLRVSCRSAVSDWWLRCQIGSSTRVIIPDFGLWVQAVLRKGAGAACGLVTRQQLLPRLCAQPLEHVAFVLQWQGRTSPSLTLQVVSRAQACGMWQ